MPGHVMLGFQLTGSVLVACVHHKMTTRSANTAGNKTTVLLRNILPTDCDESALRAFFSHHGLHVKGVELVKELARVNRLGKELPKYQQTVDRLSDAERIELVYPKWSALHRIATLAFYEQKVAHLKRELDEASKQAAYSGVASVDFASDSGAQRAVGLFRLASKVKILLTSDGSDRSTDQLAKRLRWAAVVSPGGWR